MVCASKFFGYLLFVWMIDCATRGLTPASQQFGGSKLLFLWITHVKTHAYTSTMTHFFCSRENFPQDCSSGIGGDNMIGSDADLFLSHIGIAEE